MNGLKGIRNINAAAAQRELAARRPRGAVLLTKTRDQSEDRGPARFQRQYVGNKWGVFDSATGQFGFKSEDVIEVDAEVDRLNAIPRIDPLAVQERQLTVGALLASSAKAQFRADVPNLQNIPKSPLALGETH